MYLLHTKTDRSSEDAEASTSGFYAATRAPNTGGFVVQRLVRKPWAITSSPQHYVFTGTFRSLIESTLVGWKSEWSVRFVVQRPVHEGS
jgi:hypothetical protein